MLYSPTDFPPASYLGDTLKPWAHQTAHANALPYYALFFEPRTGKSRTVLMSAEKMQQQGLKSILVVAPNGVHRNWITDELPRWWGRRVDWKAVIWRSNKAAQKNFRAALKELNAHKGIAVLAVNVDAVHNPKFLAALPPFLARGKCMGVVDESADIANISAARTKALLRLRQAFAWRRILDGTPTAENPLEVYSQAEFLTRAALGYTSFYAFRGRYAVLKKTTIGGQVMPHSPCNGKGCTGCGYTGQYVNGGRSFDTVVGYRNIEELQAKLSKFAAVVKRAGCADLPPKIIARRPFALETEQRKIYDQMKAEYVAELSGRVVTAANMLTRYLRLQQIAHNFWPAGDEGVIHEACNGAGCDNCNGGLYLVHHRLRHISDNNARLEVLLAELKRMPGQVTIWTRFVEDGDRIMAALRGNAVRYDGTVPEAERAVNRALYKSGEARYLVGSPQAGGRGLDFSHADAMVFYGHNFRLRLRMQAEDRGESLARRVSTSIVDLVAENTIDEYVLKCLAEKVELSDKVLDWRSVLA